MIRATKSSYGGEEDGCNNDRKLIGYSQCFRTGITEPNMSFEKDEPRAAERSHVVEKAVAEPGVGLSVKQVHWQW